MKRFKSKVERKYGMNLLVKGERNLGPKAAYRRKPFPPGVHGKKIRRFGKKLTEYARQFFEKQKLKILYGITENQLKNYFKKAEESKGETDIELLKLLERRLDNVIFRLGIAETRHQARQWVSHGHFLVNGKKVKKPGYLVKPGDIITIREGSKKRGPFKNLNLKLKNYRPPLWIELKKNKEIKAEILRFPEKEDLEINIEIPLIIEFYSK